MSFKSVRLVSPAIFQNNIRVRCLTFRGRLILEGEGERAVLITLAGPEVLGLEVSISVLHVVERIVLGKSFPRSEGDKISSENP